MREDMTTDCKVYMSAGERKMLNKVVEWVEENLNCTEDCDAPELPEDIIDILCDIYKDINLLLSLVSDEH